MKTAMARRPILRRLLLSLAWLGVSLAFAHLSLDSTRPRSVDVHGWLAAAAAVALVLAAASCLGHGPRLRVVSGVAAMLTTLVALGLVAVGAAHETGMALTREWGRNRGDFDDAARAWRRGERPVRRRPPVIASVHA